MLDPRVSQNLPMSALRMVDQEAWRRFLSSIFYVGKGTRSRPFSHLYEAVKISRCVSHTTHGLGTWMSRMHCNRNVTFRLQARNPPPLQVSFGRKTRENLVYLAEWQRSCLHPGEFMRCYSHQQCSHFLTFRCSIAHSASRHSPEKQR